MIAPAHTTVLILALGLLARDPRSAVTPQQRRYLQQRLREQHALNVPLLLSAQERKEFTVPLLTYIARHRPRILDAVRTYVEVHANATTS